MRISAAETELRRQLEAAALNPDHLDPWEAWKVFKQFLGTPAAIEDEGASVQFSREQSPEGQSSIYQNWIRQFAAVEDGEDTPVRYVTIEFEYRSQDLPFEKDVELWSYDFPDIAAFAAHVEALDLFQHALSAEPVGTDIICEEI